MSEFRDAGEEGVEQFEELGGRLARRLGDLNSLPAAPPPPAPVIGLVRRRRRQRQAVQMGGGAMVVALLVIVAARFVPLSAPVSAPGPEEATVRWAHLTDPDLPTAVRLHQAWLRTGDLPQTSGDGSPRPAARMPLRPLDALGGVLDPLG